MNSNRNVINSWDWKSSEFNLPLFHIYELFLLPSFMQLGIFNILIFFPLFFNLKLFIMHFFCFCNTI